MISNYCRENACFYIDNGNVRGFCLYKDGLHLLESGKKILVNNFIINFSTNLSLLEIFSRSEHTPFTNIFLNDSDLARKLSLTTDLQVLHHERLKHSKNRMIGYLSINSLRKKLTDLRVILKHLFLDYFVLSKTNLDESFPNTQFILDGYEIRARRDKNKFGGGLIEYIRKGLICKRIAKYMSQNIVNAYALKLPSPRKSVSFSVSINPQLWKT